MTDKRGFLPEDYLEKRLARRTNVICLTLFVIVAAGLWAAYFVDRAQREDVRAQLAEVNREMEEAAQRLKQLEELQAKKEEWTRKAQVAAVLIERLPRTLILSELVNHMPETLSLLDLDLKTDVVKTAPPPASKLQMEKARSKKRSAAEKAAEVVAAPKLRVSMELTGLAPTDVEIAEYITALSAHAMFRDVSLKFSEQSKVEGRDMRRFGLMMTLNNDLDLRQIEPLKVARDLKMNPMAGELQIRPVVPAPAATVTPASDHR